MTKKSERTFDRPPFPPLTWDGYYWEAQIVLPSWRGFTRSGQSGGDEEASTGTCWLCVPVADDTDPEPPTREQAGAYLHLLDQQKVILDAVLQAVADSFPAIGRAEQLRDLVSLTNVHILAQGRDGLAYVGFEFCCEWAEEFGMDLGTHSAGAGVLTRAGEVIAVGEGDISFDPPAEAT